MDAQTDSWKTTELIYPFPYQPKPVLKQLLCYVLWTW